jgi:nitrate/TMAO reductase-like tetraheme cytochrome c subunit
MFKKIIIPILILIAVISIALFNLLNNNPTENFSNPWEKAIPHQAIPKGLTSLSSKECGLCHTSHYNEWKNSTHAMAWKDVQFQAEIAKESSPYMCINCHIPLQNQQEYVITGLEEGDIYKPIQHKNPNFDDQLQQEGINCASCHVRDGAVISMEVSNKAPHKSIQNKEHLSEQLCISCHNAVAVITPELVCTFETGDEWKAGPYYKTKNCKTCHMPELQRPVAEGSAPIKSSMHYFMGSGIPKHDTLSVERLDGIVFSFNPIKEHYDSNDSIIISATATNSLAGHRVPTGDPERFIISELSIVELSTENIVAIDSFRIGELWEWYPSAKKIGDNNLNPGESRVYKIATKLPKGNYRFMLKAYKHRITDEMVVYNKLGDSYPTSILFFELKREFNVL